MSVSQTTAQSIDFDDIERQLREVARINQDRSGGGSAATSSRELAFGDELRSERRPAAAPKTRAGEARIHLGELEQVPDITQARGSSRSEHRIRSRAGLAFVLPVLVVAAGVSAVMTMRAGPMSGARGDAPVMADPVSPEALPAIVPRGDQTLSSSAADTAVSPDKLEETALALREQPDAPLAKAGSQEMAAQLSAVSPLQPAEDAPVPLPTVVAKVPLPDPPQAPAQSSIIGTPRRSLTDTVKHEELHTPSAKETAHANASAASTTKLASREARVSLNAPVAFGAVTQAARRHAANAPAKSSQAPAAERQQTSKTPMGILPPASAGTTPPRKDPSPPQGNPVASVANGLRKVLELAHIVESAAEVDTQ